LSSISREDATAPSNKDAVPGWDCFWGRVEPVGYLSRLRPIGDPRQCHDVLAKIQVPRSNPVLAVSPALNIFSMMVNYIGK
jgi:hypothetical protein